MVNVLFLLLSMIFFVISILLLIYCFYRPFPTNKGITGQQGDSNGTTGPTGSQGGTGIIGPYGPVGESGPQGPASNIYANAVPVSGLGSNSVYIKNLNGVFVNMPQLLPVTASTTYLNLYYDDDFLPGGTFYVYSESNNLVIQNAALSEKKYMLGIVLTSYIFSAGLIQCVLLGDQASLICEYINS